MVICTLAKLFSISTVTSSGFGETLKYGSAGLRIALPVPLSGQPAAVVSMGNREGFVSSCNYDSAASDLVVSLALMNFSATDVFIRAIVIGEVA